MKTLIKDSDHSVDLELKNIPETDYTEGGRHHLSAITITEAHRKLIRGSPVPWWCWQGTMTGEFPLSTMITGQERPWESVWQRPSARVGVMGVFALDVAVGVNRSRAYGRPERMGHQCDHGRRDTLCQRISYG